MLSRLYSQDGLPLVEYLIEQGFQGEVLDRLLSARTPKTHFQARSSRNVADTIIVKPERLNREVLKEEAYSEESSEDG